MMPATVAETTIRKQPKTETRWCVNCESDVPRTQFSNTQLKNRKAKCRSCCSHSRRHQEGEYHPYVHHEKNDTDHLEATTGEEEELSTTASMSVSKVRTTKSLSSFLGSSAESEAAKQKTTINSTQEECAAEMDESQSIMTTSSGYTDTLTEATGSVSPSFVAASAVSNTYSSTSSLSLPTHVGSSMAKVEMRRLIQKYGFHVVEEAFWAAKEKNISSSVAAATIAASTEVTSPSRRSSFSAVCDAAVLSGKVEVLQWVRTKGFEWSENTCAMAAKAGSLEVLKYARNNGCDWDQQTCAQAAAFGQLEILKWARNEPDCPWNEVLIRQTALSCQQNHVVAWLDSLQQE